MPRQILFLCTGNYYRSRFAEELFNHLARQVGLAWVAESAALALEKGSCNVGPISRHTLAALGAREVEPRAANRMPRQVCERDLESADLVIALKEAEHRAYLAVKFPGWPDRVKYWHVHDLDQATAEEAMAEIEALVGELVRALRDREAGESVRENH